MAVKLSDMEVIRANMAHTCMFVNAALKLKYS